MKYRVLPRFRADYQKLSPEERLVFKKALARFIAAAGDYEGNPERYVWPKSLRVERLTGSGIMAMAWSFSGPDGRATFEFVTVENEQIVVWRRVGRHSIYREP